MIGTAKVPTIPAIIITSSVDLFSSIDSGLNKICKK